MNAGFVVNVHLLPSHESPVPRYCNVFFDFFCGISVNTIAIAKLIHNNSRASFFGSRLAEGTDRVVKALALPQALLPLVINTPLSNSGLYYGFTPFPPRQPTASARLPLTLMRLMTGRLPPLLARTAKNICRSGDSRCQPDDRRSAPARRPCDAKGKMWSNLRLFRDGDGFHGLNGAACVNRS